VWAAALVLYWRRGLRFDGSSIDPVRSFVLLQLITKFSSQSLPSRQFVAVGNVQTTKGHTRTDILRCPGIESTWVVNPLHRRRRSWRLISRRLPIYSQLVSRNMQAARSYISRRCAGISGFPEDTTFICLFHFHSMLDCKPLENRKPLFWSTLAGCWSPQR